MAGGDEEEADAEERERKEKGEREGWRRRRRRVGTQRCERKARKWRGKDLNEEGAESGKDKWESGGVR